MMQYCAEMSLYQYHLLPMCATCCSYTDMTTCHTQCALCYSMSASTMHTLHFDSLRFIAMITLPIQCLIQSICYYKVWYCDIEHDVHTECTAMNKGAASRYAKRSSSIINEANAI